MDRTPQLASRFPLSPPREGGRSRQKPSSPAPGNEAPKGSATNPTIPFDVIDAPSQRLYAALAYVALLLWRLYDYLQLQHDGSDGFFLFTKWVGIDTAFLYALSGLKIPWLQWSSSTFTVMFVAHALLSWVLMFQIPLPFITWLSALTKLVYDRELAVSERRVKPGSVLHNNSLILGKQIIKILPEGSAVLNPENTPFCIGGHTSSVALPIHFAQSIPKSIEIARTDIDSGEEKLLTFNQREIKKWNKIDRTTGDSKTPADGSIYHLPTKETGSYRLQRVLDNSNLDVILTSSTATVVQCPMASIRSVANHKCIGQLSDFNFSVYGSPPLRLRYSTVVAKEDRGHSEVNVQPEWSTLDAINEQSHLHQTESGNLVPTRARAKTIQVPINETLSSPGGWQYVLNDVTDVWGNVANYSEEKLSTSNWRAPAIKKPEQHFTIHGRPRISMHGCDMQQPVKVEMGKTAWLPIRYDSSHASSPGEEPFSITYQFTPAQELVDGQTHSERAIIKDGTFRASQRGLKAHEAGLYTLKSVSSTWCQGEVIEPSSCLLLNPPEPDLNVTTEVIPDQCAGKSIGILVNLDAIGTPPFKVQYKISKRDGPTRFEEHSFHRLHEHLPLKPPDTGYYTYEFTRIADKVYNEFRPLRQGNLVVETDIKAPPSAQIGTSEVVKTCLGETATVPIQLYGEPPFQLEYELVHRKSRLTFVKKDITGHVLHLETERPLMGGEHVLVLTSLTDQSGCKTSLQAELRIIVNAQRPQGGFGQLKGERDIMTREGQRVPLPLRFQGEGPWSVSFSRSNATTFSKTFVKHNDEMLVTDRGTYEVLSVRDSRCPGNVDSSSSRFTVGWIPRPTVAVRGGGASEERESDFAKKPVCQGDEDTIELSFTGAPPFKYEYETRLDNSPGSHFKTIKASSSALNTASVEMDTSKAGDYSYVVMGLSDVNYKQPTQKLALLTIRQHVHPRPTAQFAESGKIYKYCHDEAVTGDPVQVQLTGEPPFHLELEIRQHKLSKPEVITIPHIESHLHPLQIPQRLRQLGLHFLSIRKVRDSRGCQTNMEHNLSQVQFSIAQLPSISPVEEQRDYCIGDHISFLLSGTPPFSVFYSFEERDRKAVVPNTNFRRLAEKPGNFVITSISDQRSTEMCKAKAEITKTIHEMPSVRISKGTTSTIDIREGGQASILFEFGGTPPFHFTYTRSMVGSTGRDPKILETVTDMTDEYSKTITASAEGIYEVVSIRDKYCAFSKQGSKQVRPKAN